MIQLLHNYRSLVAFKWLLRAIDHHTNTMVYGIHFILSGFKAEHDEERYIALVEHSTLADMYLNHSTQLIPEVLVRF